MGYSKNLNSMINAANITKLAQEYRQTYINKYYDLYCSLYDIEGLDYRYQRTLKAKLWDKGSIWIRKNAITGDAICCDYAPSSYDWNQMPVTAQLVSLNGAPESVIPQSAQTVDKDGVICYIRPNLKGFRQDVDYYIGKLAEAETLITINLALQRCPWILTSDSQNYGKLKLLIGQVFNNQPAIITDIDANELDHIDLNTPWLVDKITEYEERIENKLKTLLGIDNQGGYLNREQQNLDTTNSNNQEINQSQTAFFDTLKSGIDRANEILGLNLKVIVKSERIDSAFAEDKPAGGAIEEGDENE